MFLYLERRRRRGGQWGGGQLALFPAVSLPSAVQILSVASVSLLSVASVFVLSVYSIFVLSVASVLVLSVASVPVFSVSPVPLLSVPSVPPVPGVGVLVGGGPRVRPGRAAVLHWVEAHPAMVRSGTLEHYSDIVAVSSPAAAHVADGAAGGLAARAPVPLAGRLVAAPAPAQPAPLRPPVTLALSPPPRQRVALLHHAAPAPAPAKLTLHLDARQRVAITITVFSPVRAVWPVDVAAVVARLVAAAAAAALPRVLRAAAAGGARLLQLAHHRRPLPLEAGLPAVCEGRHGGEGAGAGAQGPRPRGPGRGGEGVGGPVAPGHGGNTITMSSRPINGV